MIAYVYITCMIAYVYITLLYIYQQRATASDQSLVRKKESCPLPLSLLLRVLHLGSLHALLNPL